MCTSLSLIPSLTSGSQPSTFHHGCIERLRGTDIVPCRLDPETNVLSKDAAYSPELNLSCRLYRPHSTSPDKKLPVLVYYHGGGFCIETPFNSRYNGHLNSLVAVTGVIAISVDYRMAPEHPLPIAYDDSWTALEWLASHVNGDGPEEWLNSHADFGQVFLAGDSAGANIAHQLAMRVDPLWHFVCPASSGLDDPLINPLVDPKLDSLGCSKVLVIIGGKDFLRERGWHYYEKLSKGGWGGVAEIMEGRDDEHVFHLSDPTCENAVALLKRIAAFISNDKA
ncbi:RECEPTOR GID1 putative-RELATED [Salix viminalis]|uniref:RECEPTOR GID1 putative-RELATED n=1 Tax=Salix viminalis TaxID=40686 RepID=A0A9Q0SBS6_SALVM|nr:RECEPTOR GID1 putative-RELATED [Salix viminalis]